MTNMYGFNKLNEDSKIHNLPSEVVDRHVRV